MAGKQFASIGVLETRFGHFPKRFTYNGVTHTVGSVIQTWTVNTGPNPYFRFAVVLDTGAHTDIYHFTRNGGDLWKIDVTEQKVEA